MAKTADRCYLCEESGGKLKKFTFYSGVRKGGTTHRMVNYTVTFFERWSELTMHEIIVCRDCTQQLWREKRKSHRLPMNLCAGGAAVALFFSLISIIVFPGIARYVATGGALLAALPLGALAFVQFQKSRADKPKSGQMDLLVLEEALDTLPHEAHTYMTTDQYAERYEKGVVG